MVHFFYSGWHFCLAAAVYNHGAFGTHAPSRAHAVHRGVAAAYHCHAPACRRRCVISLATGPHKVDAGQIFVARQHADIVFARYAYKARQSGTGSHKQAAESVVEQVFVAESLAYNGVGMESDSSTAQAVQLGIDNGVWQAEFGYAVFQHAANFV